MSDTPKWTEGPWTIEGLIDDSFEIIGATGAPLGVTYGADRNGEERANAHLIAAAPELYEALEGMLKHACVADADPSDKDPEDHAFERAARAALRKARGETE